MRHDAVCDGEWVAIRGVLLDFAGTLLVPVPREEWVAHAFAMLGLAKPPEEIAALAEKLERAGRSGGPEPEPLPADLEADYAARDLSTTRHRALYEALIAPITGKATPLTRQLYSEGTVGAGWTPYPDTREVLAELKLRGIGVAVVSNVGFDLRSVFADHGLAEFIDIFALSYEIGVMKPDPGMFRAACEQLRIPPTEALMVGDSATADSGAVGVGIPTLLLPYSEPGLPHGLAAVLSLLEGSRYP